MKLIPPLFWTRAMRGIEIQIVVVDIMVANISASRVHGKANPVENEPVIHPAAAKAILVAQAVFPAQHPLQHRINFAPVLVIAKNMGRECAAGDLFEAVQINFLLLYFPQIFFRRRQIHPRQLCNPLKRR